MGRVAIELARRGIDVVGVDLDDDLLGVRSPVQPDIRWVTADLSTMQLGRQFDVVAMPGNVMVFCRPQDRGPIIRTACTRHLEPGGRLVAGFQLEHHRGALTLDEYDTLCNAGRSAARSTLLDMDRRDPYRGEDYAVSVHRNAEIRAGGAPHRYRPNGSLCGGRKPGRVARHKPRRTGLGMTGTDTNERTGSLTRRRAAPATPLSGATT